MNSNSKTQTRTADAVEQAIEEAATEAVAVAIINAVAPTDEDKPELVTDGGEDIDAETRTELEDPIKVRWTGYGRGRISEYNADYNMEQGDRFIDAVSRQKTNVVIETVEEADAVAAELNSYIGEVSQRVWMNGSMDKAFRRVQNEIIDAMKARGYIVENRRGPDLRFVHEDGDGRDEADDNLDDVEAIDGVKSVVTRSDGEVVAITNRYEDTDNVPECAEFERLGWEVANTKTLAYSRAVFLTPAADPVDEYEFLDTVRLSLPDDYRERDTLRFLSGDVRRADIILCRRDDYDRLTSADGVDDIPMTCICWAEGRPEYEVRVGSGDLDTCDVSELVSSHTDIAEAVDAACATLEQDDDELVTDGGFDPREFDALISIEAPNGTMTSGLTADDAHAIARVIEAGLQAREFDDRTEQKARLLSESLEVTRERGDELKADTEDEDTKGDTVVCVKCGRSLDEVPRGIFVECEDCTNKRLAEDISDSADIDEDEDELVTDGGVDVEGMALDDEAVRAIDNAKVALWDVPTDGLTARERRRHRTLCKKAEELSNIVTARREDEIAEERR